MARTTSRAAGSGRGRPVAPRRTIWMLPLIVGVLVVLVIGSWYTLASTRGGTETPGDHTETKSHNGSAVELPHIHGLGFSPDGEQLVVPAHMGLRIFADNTWRSPDVPVHDYMGYVATDDGFYSSGHPDPASGLTNPLGLVKSTDGGRTLTTLGFVGESDFHLMGVGYQNHAIYVLNPAANSQLGAGMYYSLDDGQTWQQSDMQGVTAQPIQIAVHPTDPNVVALSTEAGLLLSTNHGDTFERVGAVGPVTAASFSPNGEHLYFGANTLSLYDFQDEQVKPLQTPAIASQDAISYIAINPVQPNEIAIATFKRNIYLSKDAGQSWEQIAQDGTGVAAK